MAFNATLETNNSIAKITLSGELDASTAPEFKAEVDKAAASENIKSLVLMMQDLEYMSSAGLRVIIHGVQAMRRKGDTQIYVVSPQEMVMDTLVKTQVINSVHLLDEYDESKIK